MSGKAEATMFPIQGPVERVDGAYCLMIPLHAGGRELVPLTRRIGTVEGDFLKVVVPDWMMRFLNIREGGEVIVDIVDGKFNIKSAEWNPGDPVPTLPCNPPRENGS